MRHFVSIFSLVVATALLVATGAGSGGPTAVNAGASKKQLLAALGAPTVSRGAVRNDFDQVVEVWEYWSGASGDEACWYYFVGNQLVTRRAARNWATEPGRIKNSLFEPVA